MVGSALKVLVEAGQWPGGKEEDKLKSAFKEFQAWTKLHKIPYLSLQHIGSIYVGFKSFKVMLKLCFPRHSQPNLSLGTSSLAPVFKCKAYNATWVPEHIPLHLVELLLVGLGLACVHQGPCCLGMAVYCPHRHHQRRAFWTR